MYTERVNYLEKQLSLSKPVGTQAPQVIEKINYLLDCHAGVAGSSPVRSAIPCAFPHKNLCLFKFERESHSRAAGAISCRLGGSVPG
jgi:hypothetical protein